MTPVLYNASMILTACSTLFPSNYLSVLNQVQSVDLSAIQDRIAYEQSWDDEYSARVVYEYRRMLVMHAVLPKFSVVPSKAVDEAWHAHILYTKKYFHDTKGLFGHYLHHMPADSVKGKIQEEEKQSLKNHFAITRALYTCLFQEDMNDIWVSNGKCGSGCGGSDEAGCSNHCSADGAVAAGCGHCKGDEAGCGHCKGETTEEAGCGHCKGETEAQSEEAGCGHCKSN